MDEVMEISKMLHMDLTELIKKEPMYIPSRNCFTKTENPEYFESDVSENSIEEVQSDT